MNENGVTADRLTVETSGFFTRRHRLLAAGQFVGELALSLGPSALYTDAEGRQARMGKPSIWRSEYMMWRGDQERASARLRPFRRQIEIQFEGRPCPLRPTGLTLRTWELTDTMGEPVLTVRRSGWWGAEIAIHRDVDGDLLAFAYYLVVTRWRAARRRRA